MAPLETRYARVPSIHERLEEDRARPRVDYRPPVERLTGDTSALPVQVIRLGDGPDILFPGTNPADIHTYLQRIKDTGLFAGQAAKLEQIAKLPATRAAGPDGRRQISVMLSEPMQLLPGDHYTLQRHLQHIEEFGGRPLLVPPMADLMMRGEQRAATIRAMAATQVGHVMPGGADVDARIGDQPSPFALSTNYPRDLFEADYGVAAMGEDCQLLAVCRGHQLINKRTGGKLTSDMKAEGRSVISLDQRDHGLDLSQPFFVPTLSGKILHEHRVVTAPGSQAAEIGGESLVVNQLRHQGVLETGAFVATGHSYDADTGSRNIEIAERWNGVSIQSHPELSRGNRPLEAFYDHFGRHTEIFQLSAAHRGNALERRMRDSRHFSDADFRWVRANATRFR